MDLRPVAVIDRFRGKALRYVSVSVIGTILTQVQLFVYVQVLGWNGSAGELRRRQRQHASPATSSAKYWVWQQLRPGLGREREALPFWGLNLAGLVLSTLFVVIADHFTDAWWAINVANLAGFGVLWVAKFLILDEYLFKSDAACSLEI